MGHYPIEGSCDRRSSRSNGSRSRVAAKNGEKVCVIRLKPLSRSSLTYAIFRGLIRHICWMMSSYCRLWNKMIRTTSQRSLKTTCRRYSISKQRSSSSGMWYHICVGELCSLTTSSLSIKNHLKIIDKNRTIMFPLTVV